jgi:predicted glycoside hydrolase/deacetylase ChbG (UPF0249 family)
MPSQNEKTTDRACRKVIFHADDFGLNAQVTDGIERGFAQGLLTSTSLLANAPDAQRAMAVWKRLDAAREEGKLPSESARRMLGDNLQRFDLGIHLNLTQGRPLTGDRYPSVLLDRNGRFPDVFTLFYRLRRHWSKVGEAVQEELRRQVEVLVDCGLQPTHLNGHQYVEMLPALSEIVSDLPRRYNIPVIRVAVEPSLFKSIVATAVNPQTPDNKRSAYLAGLAVSPLVIAKQGALGLIKRGYAKNLRKRMDRLSIPHCDCFFGTIHAGRIDMRLMKLFLTAGRRNVVEIGLHPALVAPSPRRDDPDGWTDPLAAERPKELDMLLSPELNDFLLSKGIQLSRLSDLATSS